MPFLRFLLSLRYHATTDRTSATSGPGRLVAALITPAGSLVLLTGPEVVAYAAVLVAVVLGISSFRLVRTRRGQVPPPSARLGAEVAASAV